MKDKIILCTKNIVNKLLKQDRKSCEEVPPGAIENAVKIGIITKEEIVEVFSSELDDYLFCYVEKGDIAEL